MPSPDYQEFLQVIPRFQWDEVMLGFFPFVRGHLRQMQGALNPVACLIFCSWYGKSSVSSASEFKLLAEPMRDVAFRSFHKFAAEVLMPLQTSNASVMTLHMVGVLEDA